MDASDVIAIVAVVIAIVAIIPGLLSWREARKQTTLAKSAAAEAKADAELAKTQAATAKQQVEAMKEQVVVARDHAAAAQHQAQAASRAAGAAEGTSAAAAKSLLFEIDRALAGFDDVHIALRPGGPGWFTKGQESSADRWVRVERYMGTFERIQAMVEVKLLDPTLVEELYGYRISNLVNDDSVYRYKLVENAWGWRRFIQLWTDLDALSRQRRQKPLARRSPTERADDEARP